MKVVTVMKYGKNIVSYVFLAVLIAILLFTGLREVTREIFVEKFSMDNVIVRMILFDHQELMQKESENVVKENIWQKYAIDDGNEKDENIWFLDQKIEVYENRIQGIEEKVTDHMTERLPFYHYLVVCGNEYEEIMGWDYAMIGEYNPVIEIEKKSFAALEYPVDCSANERCSDEIREISEFCRDNDVEFLYVLYPRKIAVEDDVSGVLDFSNYNRDELIGALRNKGISCLDMRTVMTQYGAEQHKLFFDTDHHWKPETGMMTAKMMLDYVEKEVGANVDSSLISIGNFDEKVYENYWLGSAGEKVTTARADKEDFVLYSPHIDSMFHYEIPSMGVDLTGDFMVMIDKSQLNINAYGYSDDAYGAYDYGDRDVKRIDNLMRDDGYKILIIHDSFSDVVIPFMALGVDRIDEMDLRYYHESVYKYIEDTKPDLVIVAYSDTDNEECYNFR